MEEKEKIKLRKKMKLLTINVHSWLEENQEEKMEILAKVIAEKEYDVVAFQEVNQKIKSKLILKEVKEDNFLHQLLQKIKKYTEENYEYVWSYSHIGFDIYEEGIALLRDRKSTRLNSSHANISY